MLTDTQMLPGQQNKVTQLQSQIKQAELSLCAEKERLENVQTVQEEVKTVERTLDSVRKCNQQRHRDKTQLEQEIAAIEQTNGKTWRLVPKPNKTARKRTTSVVTRRSK